MFLILLFLLLWFVYIRVPQEVEEEGVEIAFGEVDDAGGYMPEESESVPLPSEAAAPQQPSAPSDNDLITQEDEESLALKRQRDQEEKARQQAEAERLRKQREEQARLEQERKEREAAEAARKAKEAEAIANANAMGSLFGNSGNTSGSGDGQGSGQKGNPVGHGSSGGNNWSLEGRGLKSLPKPSTNFNQTGWVEISITVDAAGNVIDARWSGKGTIGDQVTINIAIDAAKKAKFTEGKNTQYGSIKYYFKEN